MSELNPHHPATQEMHDLWHKVVGILMHKWGKDKIVLTSKDIQAFSNRFKGQMGCVVFSSKGDVMTLRLVSEAEGRRLAASEDPR